MVCNKCQINKSEGEFYSHSGYECKVCVRLRVHEYRASNKGKISKRQKKRREEIKNGHKERNLHIPDQKKCSSCCTIKQKEDFNQNFTRSSGLTDWCRDCQRQYRGDHRDEASARNKKWREANPDRIAEIRKRYRESARSTNYWRKRYRKRALGDRAYWLWKKYRMTMDEYDAIFIEQGGVCAICSADPKAFTRPLAVDHDHETGMIRGLLCTNCNSGIGKLKDSPVILERAIKYLESAYGPS